MAQRRKACAGSHGGQEGAEKDHEGACDGEDTQKLGGKLSRGSQRQRGLEHSDTAAASVRDGHDGRTVGLVVVLELDVAARSRRRIERGAVDGRRLEPKIGVGHDPAGGESHQKDRTGSRSCGRACLEVRTRGGSQVEGGILGGAFSDGGGERLGLAQQGAIQIGPETLPDAEV
jgi:hypothetical protein